MNAISLIKEKLSLLTRDPICDIEETHSHTILSFDLPNMKSEDFDISVNGKNLLISVKRHHICPQGSENTKVIACHHHNFSREFSFPILLSADRLDAYYQSGILRIAVPKAALMVRQTVPVGDSPCGIFTPATKENISPIESYSDIDDYDWE